MNFQPIVPLGGNAGWAFLQRTEIAQREAFERSPVNQRETEYFKDNIGNVSTAEELVGDFRLLRVALGAFGLGEDIQNKAFIQKILEGGVLDEDSLANRLSDSRYFEMTRAFGFDLGTPSTKLSTFPGEIVSAFEDRQFEAAIGEQSQEMRLALGLQRDLVEIAESGDSENAMWFKVMGTPPLRTVFETAFGLPSSFGAIDLDQQLKVLKDKSATIFGDTSITQFADEPQQDELLRRFFALGAINQAGSIGVSGASAALSLLQSSRLTPLT